MRTWTDGKDNGSREYKKGKRVIPGTGNTRNNIQIIKDKRKRTNKDQRKNAQHWSRLLNLIYFTVYIDMTYDYRPTRRRHPQAPPAGAHLLPLPPAGTRSDMDKTAILLSSAPSDATPNRRKTEGHGEEEHHDRPSTPGHHGGNAGVANIVISDRHGERAVGT
jgi:hypothetical protein